MSLKASAYSSFNALLARNGHALSAAELHGLLLGRSTAGAGFAAQEWLHEAAVALGAESLDDSVRQALLGLQLMAKDELGGEGLSVVLLLPADEAPLTERVAATAQWCQGFLDGFGLAAGDRPLSKEVDEVLQDLSAIARAESRIEDSEEGERDYTEVVEYLRLVPVLLFTECNPQAKSTEGDSLGRERLPH